MPAYVPLVLCVFLGCAPVFAPDGPPSTPAAKGDPALIGASATQAGTTGEATSAAEQVGRLQKSIASARERIEQLKADRDGPAGEYALARSAFEAEDATLQAARKSLKALAPGSPERPELAARLAETEASWKLAKDRFDLAIEGRKTAAEQVVTLEQKIGRDTEALDKLEGRAPVAAPPAEPPVPATGPAPPAPSAPLVAPPVATPVAPASPVATPAAAPTVAAPSPPAPVVAAPGSVVVVPAPSEKPPREELVAARADAETKAAASREAEQEARTVAERLAGLDKDIALEQKLLANGRKKRDNASATRTAATEEFRTRSMEGAPRDVLNGLLKETRAAEGRHKLATEEVQEHTLRLDELQTERAGLLAEQVDAMKNAAAARAEVEKAEKEIRRLNNPFSPTNVLRWLAQHGPPMLLIVAAMVAGHWLSRLFSRRVIHLVAHDGARGGGVEREARARTLVGVFHNAASVTIFIGGGLMILQEAGIPIAPLLGGAAVFGLAVAFGAQNLIRDYFYGFVILLENQYKLNDVVKIGDLSGQVEKITLRMTVLRDLEGRVHFVPNGQVTAVTNLTHGWSRALFDIGVAYKEDVDAVMAVLAALAADLQRDPQFAPLILDGVTMLGVDELGDSAVVIKFYIQTRPLQQWPVKRELLRRIKNRFDELGIEIPYPHRMVFHRNDSGTGDSSVPAPKGLFLGDRARRPSA